jgi:hypothetical protein
MKRTANKMVFYRPQPDSMGVLEPSFIDDDSFSDTPPVSIAEMLEIDTLKATAPNESGLWMWERDIGFRRFTESEVVEFAAGRSKTNSGWTSHEAAPL